MTDFSLRRHLHAKLAAAGFAVQCVLVVFFLIGEWHGGKKQARETLQQTLAQATPLLKTALLDPLLERDELAVKSILEDAKTAGLMQQYVLRGPQNQILHSSHSGQVWPPMPSDSVDSALPWARDPPLFHHQIRIGNPAQDLATLHLIIPLESAIRAYQSSFVKNILVAVFLMFVGTLAIYLLSENITRQLRTIAMASRLLGMGGRRLDIPVKGDDEVAQLGNTINQMSEAIGERIQKLTESEQKQRFFSQLAQAEHARLNALLESMQLGVLLVDQAQQILHVNEATRQLWQVSEDLPLQGQSLGVFQSSSARFTHAQEADRTAWFSTDTVAHARVEIALEGVTLEQTSHQVRDDSGQVIGFLWIFEDVTRERIAQATIHRLVQQDTLTGVLNRYTLMERLEELLSGQPEQNLILLYLDLDNFKTVNDIHGHAFGDKLLVQVTEAMRSALRPHDIMGRIGGDEFVIVPRQIELEQLPILCERLIKCINQTSRNLLRDQAQAAHLGCSIGIAVYPQDGANAEALLEAADSAMYAAKGKGRNTWQWFTSELPQTAQKTQWMIWQARIGDALTHNLFELYFQGVHDSQSGALVHHEVLCRLPDPQRPGEHFMPQEFIRHAEQSGQILPLDRWVLAHSIDHLGLHPDGPPLAVNLSARSLIEPSLPTFIAQCLSAAQVEPQRLHIELTETVALEQLDLGSKHIQALQALGCVISLDDMGSGFRSVSDLKRLDADYIKIDGALMRAVVDDPLDRIMLQAIVAAAHHKGKKVVAEWIETPEQLALAREFGIDWVQGYLFQMPYLAISGKKA